MHTAIATSANSPSPTVRILMPRVPRQSEMGDRGVWLDADRLVRKQFDNRREQPSALVRRQHVRVEQNERLLNVAVDLLRLAVERDDLRHFSERAHTSDARR